MAQNITLMGASYSAVPAVNLPKTGGGTAKFTDVGDTTATANDVASGKYFYTAAGVKAEGSATGGSVSITDVANNTGTTGQITGTPSPSGTKSITANGTGIDVASYAYADVAVPNTYSAGDEGKVVSNGALVSQTSDTVTENDTYDTTLINSLTVNVSGSVNTFPKTGTITPASRTTSISFDVGTTDTIKHLLIVPTSETPLKSGGKTVIAVISNAENSFWKYLAVASNNAGTGFLAGPALESTTYFSQSGSTITVSPQSAGSFETVSYTWYAW